MTAAVAIDVSAIPAQPVGAGIYVVELVRALADAGELPLALVTRRDDAPRWQALAPDAAVVPASPAGRPARLVWEQLGAPLIARRLKPSVWHGPHYSLPLVLSTPRVVTVHDLTFFDNPEWHERSKVAFFTRMIRASTRRADLIISVSDRTAARLRELRAPDAPVVSIPLGVDHDRFAPLDRGGGAGDLARLATLGVRPPFVAFAGTVEPRKNLPGLIRAFARIAPRHPDLTLVVAGRPGWGSDEVAAALAACTVRDRIQLLGYVDADVIPALWRTAAAVAYVPFAEGFGLNALEAVACGAVLVTTAGTPMADMVGDAALTVPPGDDDALADALDALLAGGPDIDAMRRRGPPAAAPWTWARCAAAHADAYRQVAID